MNNILWLTYDEAKVQLTKFNVKVTVYSDERLGEGNHYTWQSPDSACRNNFRSWVQNTETKLNTESTDAVNVKSNKQIAVTW